ncbi:MAG: putative lipid II flippase FtsW [Actinobacteria bacterium]|nr:putative lipid II flippase FtsW [Actinomycetota bacterium]
MTVREHDFPRLRALRVPGRGRLRSYVDGHHAGPWTRDATVLTALTAALLVLGLVMSFSASIVDAAENGDVFGIFRRQLGWALLGIPAFLFVSSLHHRVWRRTSWFLLAGSLLLLAVVLTPVGVSRFGSARWVGVGPLVVQPSEVAKIATLLWLADVFARKREKGIDLHDLTHLLVPAIPLLAVEAVLVLLEPDLGTTIILGVIVALVLWIEGLPMRWFGIGGVLSTLAVAALAFGASYRAARIHGWLDPEKYADSAGFQLLQAKFAMADGGVFGLGLGASRGKWNYIPNPETDFIFAIIGEELGMVGAMFVLALFAGILVVGLRTARDAEDGFGRTVAFVITGWIVGQALINVGTVTGLLPITGVTLPLVSVGGSSLVSTLVALGILVSISRRAEPRGRIVGRAEARS